VNPSSLDVPCVLFALAREAHFFRRAYQFREPFPGAPCKAWFCGPAQTRVLVMETGIGAARTHRALDWLLHQPAFRDIPYRPRFILSAGFSGALDEERRVGDVVLATETADLEGNRWPATWGGGTEFTPFYRGRLLTVLQLLGDPVEKRRLGHEHGAVAVDMETATVARLCSARLVPFGCVRVISDDVHTPLSPRLVTLLSEGRVSPWRVLGAVLTAPRLTGELWRLARHTRWAAKQLGKALEELLTVPSSDPVQQPWR
jgi:nucleoside phosphorylase